MKKILALLLAFIALVLPLSGCTKQSTTQSNAPSDNTPTKSCFTSDAPSDDGSTNTVLITVKGYGQIEVVLYPEQAPITVANFKGLVQKGHYDGLIFHRIIEGFMIQGGDGKEVPSIKGEFALNGVENNIKHQRGTISMARTPDLNSASDQFFICQAPYPYGDGQYAAFGQVTEGMEVVDRIAAVPTNYNDRPLIDVVIESIVFVEE